MKKNDNVIGKGFDQRPENINKAGRPKKTILSIITELKSQGYERATSYNVMEVYEYLIAVDRAKVVALSNDTGQPMIIHLVCKAMLSEKGGDMLERLLDRAHGKSIARVEAKEAITFHPTITMATEEELEMLEKVFGKR